MEIITKYWLSGVGLAATLSLGFWLSSLGKPYHGLLFNVHKLAALGAVILGVVQISRVLRGGTAPTAVLIGMLVLAAVCVLALFVSGALMSAGKLDYALMLTVHRVATPVLVVSLGLAVSQMGNSQ